MSEPKDKFVSKNLRVNLTVNMQKFKGMLSDFNEESKTLTFSTDKSASPGNNVQYEITTRKNEVVDGTGKILSVSLSNTFKDMISIVVKYNQLTGDNQKKLLAEFEAVQGELSDFFKKINGAA